MIIGLGHMKRQGKDTFAKFLQEELPDSVIMSFADPLYEVCESLFGYAGVRSRQYYIDSPDLKEVPLANGLSPRQILLGVGEKMREVYSNIWVELLLNRAKNHDFVIVPDVRHMNEVEAIRNDRGLLLKIVRPGEVKFEEGDIDLNLKDFNDWDECIINDGSLEALQLKAKLFVEDLIS